MKKLMLSVVVLFTSVNLYAQTKWNADVANSDIGFSVTHMMISEIDGAFKDFNATMTSTKEDFEDSKIEFTAKAASITTNNDKRDAHLRNDDFFAADKYPDITFKSVSFKKVADKKYKMVGNLTMRGVTRSITLDVTLMGTFNDPYGHTRAAFYIVGKLIRKDYGISWSASMDNGGSVVSNEVLIKSNVEMIKEK